MKISKVNSVFEVVNEKAYDQPFQLHCSFIICNLFKEFKTRRVFTFGHDIFDCAIFAYT